MSCYVMLCIAVACRGECKKGDFRAAVEADRGAAGGGTSAGIAKHVFIPPESTSHGTGYGGAGYNGNSTG
jgi:hypothetical protein